MVAIIQLKAKLAKVFKVKPNDKTDLTSQKQIAMLFNGPSETNDKRMVKFALPTRQPREQRAEKSQSPQKQASQGLQLLYIVLSTPSMFIRAMSFVLVLCMTLITLGYFLKEILMKFSGDARWVYALGGIEGVVGLGKILKPFVLKS